MTRHRVLAQVAALALSAPCTLLPQTSTISVPFVGCPSDGQAGPVEAPKGTDIVVNATIGAASKLAYYSSRPPAGVLAPRGWHCFGVYGSGGDSLIVTPEPVDASTVFPTDRIKFVGPVIVLHHTYGDTSGRSRVAQVIARVFPKYTAFVTGVKEMHELPANLFPSGPYPTDKLLYRSTRVVEFRTPAHADGLGTDAWLKKGDAPIDGVAILVGDTWDLLLSSVRLPRDMATLTPVIIHQLELDASRPRN